MNRKDFVRVCEEYCKGKDFMLNPEKDFLDGVFDGVMKVQEKAGFRYCPCRVTSGDFEKDVELLCPCYFQKQETWEKGGRCWCGLFVRRKNE